MMMMKYQKRLLGTIIGQRSKKVLYAKNGLEAVEVFSKNLISI
jgi:hypothetical protein